MRTKYFIFTGVLFMMLSLSAQESLNAYKYVSISKRFEFQKSEDSYQINSLLKFLFDKEGFQTLYADEKYPEEMQINPCLGLRLKLIDESNMFKTKVQMELYNCKNELVLKTEKGESREKDYKKGYHEAIRNAFTTIENTPYNYTDDKSLVDIKVQPDKKVVPKVSEEVKKEPVLEEIIIPEKMEKAVMTDPKYQDKVAVIAERQISKIPVKTIEGTYISEDVHISIHSQGNQYVIYDNQNNIIGILYPTSQASYFIVKWLQSDDNLPKLVYLNDNGDVVIDGVKRTDTYKRN